MPSGAAESGLIADRFRVSGLFGVGATASVYDAIDTRDGARVAVKVLHPHLSESAAARAAFLREAEVLTGIRHPSLATVVDAGSDESGDGASAWTAWRPALGLTLAEHVRSEGPLRPATAVDVARRVLDGLGALHDAGLVHRDISPTNIVVDIVAGRVRDVVVVDFGLVGPAGTTTHGADVLRSVAGDGVIGNPQYASPELVRGEPVGPVTDLYEVAGILYFALVGAPPYPRADSDAAIRAHQSAPPPTASVRAPGTPPAVDRAIVRAMLKDPGSRFGSAAEMSDALGLAVPMVAPTPARATPSGAPLPPTDPGTTKTRVLVPDRPETAPDLAAARRSRGAIPAWVSGTALLVAVVVSAVVVVFVATPPRSAAEADPPPTTAVTPVAPPSSAPPVVEHTPEVAARRAIPALEGMTEDAATAALQSAGFAVGERRTAASPRGLGTVVASEPAAGSEMDAGAAVTLIVASGSNVVPDVVGETELAASEALTLAGFTPILTSLPGADAAAGTVVRTHPGSAGELPLGTSVVIVVARALAPSTPTPTPTPTVSGAPTTPNPLP